MIIGLVGSPSAGKSTFFRASTLADAEIANYPFTTLSPNEGFAHVKIDCVDKEFQAQCTPREGYCLKHKRFVPFKLIDVAGLVPDAHKGRGRGLEFLSDLNQADALIHIIDISGSTNEEGISGSPGTYDPEKVLQFFGKVLDMWYFTLIQKGWDKFVRTVQQERQDLVKAVAKRLSGMRVDELMVEEALKILFLSKDITTWNEEQLLSFCSFLRKKSKPMIIACNKVDLPGAYEQYQKLSLKYPEFIMISCSADAELALREASKKNLIFYVPGDKEFTLLGNVSEQQKKVLEHIQNTILGRYGSTGVQLVLDTIVLKVLEMIAVFPGGVSKLEDSKGRRLPDCFLMKKGTTALDFAYHLHTDLGKGFIRAIDVHTKRTVGKEHVLGHRDVIEIISRS